MEWWRFLRFLPIFANLLEKYNSLANQHSCIRSKLSLSRNWLSLSCEDICHTLSIIYKKNCAGTQICGPQTCVLCFKKKYGKADHRRIHQEWRSYYVCNWKSYHWALNMRWRWFRSADNDEPLRYAARTLIAIRTMNGLRIRTWKIKGKSWYDNNWFVSL